MTQRIGGFLLLSGLVAACAPRDGLPENLPGDSTAPGSAVVAAPAGSDPDNAPVELLSPDIRRACASVADYWRAWPGAAIRRLDSTLTKNFRGLKPALEVAGAWQVQFDPSWFYPGNGTGELRFEQLTDWTQRPEEAVRYFSGIATYKTTFESKLKDTKARVFLDLGVVKNVARVRLNGRDLGVVWTAPWHLEGGALKAGANELEIEVANLWPNRLIGDATLPIEKRRTATNVRTYDTMASGTYGCTKCAERKKSGKPAELLSSGLLGPVRVIVEE